MTGSLYLVRHAYAGDRKRWEGPDFLRPLTPKGWRQAEALIERFVGIELERLVSSPYVRCVQSLQPMASDRTLQIEPHDDLAEGTPARPAIDLLESLVGSPMGLCSHGDVIEASVRELISRGMRVKGRVAFAKGSIWELRGRKGSIESGRYIAAP
jgi:8-oxo-dGTP diphosphatase